MATAILASLLACAPVIGDTIKEQLTFSAGGVTATVDVNAAGNLIFACSSTAPGACGNVALKSSAEGADGTIDVVHASLQGYTFTATAGGWGDDTPPTIQDLDLFVSRTGQGSGTFTAAFSADGFPRLTHVLDTADAATTDLQLSGSSVRFLFLSDGSGALRSGKTLGVSVLRGHSSSGEARLPNPNWTPATSFTSEAIFNFTGKGTIQANSTVADEVVEAPSIALALTAFGCVALVRRKSSHCRRPPLLALLRSRLRQALDFEP